MRKTLTFESTFNGNDIQNTEAGSLIGCLKKTYQLLNVMLEKHSQILLNGYCCKYPNDGVRRDQSNDTFLHFLGKFIDQLRHAGYDPMFVWCREYKRDENKPHWHFSILLNANKVRYLDNSYASSLWNNIINAGDNFGCLDQADLGGAMRGMIIKRGDDLAFAEAIYKTSYLAKFESKENVAYPFKRYDGSQVG